MSKSRLIQAVIFRGDVVRPELQRMVALFAAEQLEFGKNCCTLRDGQGQFIASICWTPQLHARRFTP